MLALVIVLFIFVVYTGCNTKPDVSFFKIGGYDCGINFTENVYLKLLWIGTSMLYILMPDERDC